MHRWHIFSQISPLTHISNYLRHVFKHLKVNISEAELLISPRSVSVHLPVLVMAPPTWLLQWGLLGSSWTPFPFCVFSRPCNPAFEFVYFLPLSLTPPKFRPLSFWQASSQLLILLVTMQIESCFKNNVRLCVSPAYPSKAFPYARNKI